MVSWGSGTSKQYQNYFTRWEKYCQSKGLRKFKATMENGINFLATLFSTGLEYSAINTAGSALLSVLVLLNNITFGTHSLSLNLPFLARAGSGMLRLYYSTSRRWAQHLITRARSEDLNNENNHAPLPVNRTAFSNTLY